MSPDPHTPHHATEPKIDTPLSLAQDTPLSFLHVMGYSRWRHKNTMSVISLPFGELGSSLDQLRLHQKTMRRPRPGGFGGPPTDFFPVLASLTVSRTTVFHTGKTHEEQALHRAMARIAERLSDAASALVLMRKSGGGGPVWHHLTRERTAPLPSDSLMLAELPCSEADTLLLVDLARTHAWASHQYRNRPNSTNDPRRPSSPPPGAEAPEAL